MNNKTTVIHHSADYDGIASREVAKRFLGTDDVTFIGWDYGDPLIPFLKEGTVYVIDLNPEVFEEMVGIDEAQKRLIWIDHHKTAIDKWGDYIPGYRIDGVAACRLAYQWFSMNATLDPRIIGPKYALPDKEQYLARKVIEPFALTLLGEYDVWDHRGDGDLELQFGLRCYKEPDWRRLFYLDDKDEVEILIEDGRTAMAYSQNVDASTMRRSFAITFQNIKFLALNTARCNSNTFAALDKPETGHEALMAFYWNGRKWTFSLYHSEHRKDLDLSQLAKAYGGGGHRGACGFQTDQIPFPLFATPRLQ